MALQTNVLRGGEWVTETVNFDSVLKGNAPASSTETPRQSVSKPGSYGILTKTVVESPLARFILPVRLRSDQHRDVAFIGDHYVQISELGRDSQLHDVIRKNDFGSRIINAKVIGVAPESTADDDDDDDDVEVKMEEDSSQYGGMHDTRTTATPLSSPSHQQQHQNPTSGRPSRMRLPPQQLLVILENGDQIFLFLRQHANDRLEFVSAQYQAYRDRALQPGYHAAVDPSSRYMALACAEDLFVVHELESPRTLSQAYTNGQELRYIKSQRPRPVQGIIHKMEFLYPLPNDDYHIILLLIIHHHGQSRMVVYEWEAGESLKDVLRVEKYGQLLPESIQRPLLIVPLTFHSAFFAVAGEHILVCENALHRPADFVDFHFDKSQLPPSPYEHIEPSWSAWTRPYRLPTYNATNDSIYLARQDGNVVYIELNSDNLVTSVLYVGKLTKEISTSFCSLFDHFSDILIAGSRTGPSSIHKLLPRKPTEPLGKIPNWAPVADFVTSDEFATTRRSATDPKKRIGASGTEMPSWRDRTPGTYTAPDRMFAASGSGVTGAITEFRHGLKAYAGLDFDTGETIRRAWTFPMRSVDYDLSFHILVSFVDRSLALLLSADLTQVSHLGGDDGDDRTQAYDLESRTVAAALLSEDVVIQVTENNLVFAAASGSVFHAHAKTFGGPVTVVDACISGALVAISTHTRADAVSIHLLRLGSSGAVTVVKSFEQSGNATCLSLSSFGNKPAIVAGLVHDGNKPSIAIYSINESDRTGNSEAAPYVIDLSSGEMGRLLSSSSSSTSLTGGQATVPIEPLSSIVMLPRQGRATAVVFGTRAGQVGTVVLDDSGHPASANLDTVGLATVYLTVVNDAVLGKSILATCDGRLCMQSKLDWQKAQFRSMEAVWVIVDAPDISKPSPFITSTSILQGGLPGRDGSTTLVFSSRSRVMLAELHPHTGHAHRTMPLKGTPTSIIYSHHLDCLVVAIHDASFRTTLQFIDPDTGDDLSLPIDRHGNRVDFVYGLGEEGDRILSLAEWIYEHDGNLWVFILVATMNGRFLVLSTKRAESRRDSGGGGGGGDNDDDAASTPARNGIQYWTRHRKARADYPVYAVASEDDNVFCCIGQMLHWDKLDLVAKKLVPHGHYELPSVATSLRIVNGKLVALTQEDSVQIIDFKSGNSAAGHMSLHHADPELGKTGQLIDMYPEGAGTTAAALPLLLVSSGILASSGPTMVSGLWVPWSMIGRDCSLVFEADIPSQRLCRLVRGRTRPVWQQARRDVRYGMLTSTGDGAEVLGACEDGSLHHFTLLGPEIWRIMRYIQNLASTSAVLYPYTYEEPVASSSGGGEGGEGGGQDDELNDMLEDLEMDGRSGMQIDGDMLQRCLDSRALEQLFSEHARAARLFGLLDKLDGGRWTSSFRQQGTALADEALLRGKGGSYFGLLYDILEFYLAPVF